MAIGLAMGAALGFLLGEWLGPVATRMGPGGSRPERVGRIGKVLRERNPRRLGPPHVPVGQPLRHQAEDVGRDDRRQQPR